MANPWEEALRSELGSGRSLGDHRDEGIDFLSSDGTQAFQVKASIQGARDLHASLTHLAIYVGTHAEARRATLIASVPKMSRERVRQEWDRVQTIMRPGVGRRIALVALSPGGDTALPDDAETRAIAEKARRSLDASAIRPRATRAARWTPKTYEVWKVLLAAWLTQEPPLPLHEIMRRSGASGPIVSQVLDRLETSGELLRTSSRSSTLTGLPRRSFAEVAALGDGLRETHRFVDRSGRAPDTRDLLRRFSAKRVRHTALGGVEAARHYMPSFDLNGLPRIDVSTVDDDLAWVRKIDPALTETSTSPSGPSPVLVVHRLRRPEPRFDDASGAAFADPAEVLLDLHELRLVDQADELVHALRRSPLR